LANLRIDFFLFFRLTALVTLGIVWKLPISTDYQIPLHFTGSPFLFIEYQAYGISLLISFAFVL